MVNSTEPIKFKKINKYLRNIIWKRVNMEELTKQEELNLQEKAKEAIQNRINAAIAGELKVKVHQVTATINLLDDGNTVPSIARYR